MYAGYVGVHTVAVACDRSKQSASVAAIFAHNSHVYSYVVHLCMPCVSDQAWKRDMGFIWDPSLLVLVALTFTYI